MEEKVCLVAGASVGSIGSGIAKSLAEAGFKKMVVVARTKSKLEETAKASKEAGAEEVLVLPKDLFLPGASEEVVKETVDHFGRLDVLVYAAGQEGYATIADLKMEEAEKIMRFNYFVPLEMTKMALPHLRKTKGNVVFITSCIYFGHQFGIGGPPKGALLLLCKILALEEAANGVRANSVSPGAITTPTLMHFLGTDDKEKADNIAKEYQPLRKAGKPEDIGKAVAFLADDRKAAFVTGSEFFIDGALSLAPSPPPAT